MVMKKGSKDRKFRWWDPIRWAKSKGGVWKRHRDAKTF